MTFWNYKHLSLTLGSILRYIHGIVRPLTDNNIHNELLLYLYVSYFSGGDTVGSLKPLVKHLRQVIRSYYTSDLTPNYLSPSSAFYLYFLSLSIYPKITRIDIPPYFSISWVSEKLTLNWRFSSGPNLVIVLTRYFSSILGMVSDKDHKLVAL